MYMVYVILYSINRIKGRKRRSLVRYICGRVSWEDDDGKAVLYSRLLRGRPFKGSISQLCAEL